MKTRTLPPVVAVLFAALVLLSATPSPANTFLPMAQMGQPAMPRFDHSQVWTGDRLIVWGGAYWINPDTSLIEIGTYADGAAYIPASNNWSPISQLGAPSARRGHSAVWTGSEMIIWGGANDSWALIDGAIYDPSNDQWRPMAPALTSRRGHTAVWTGTEMIVWGGIGSNRGMAYNPTANTWRFISSIGEPASRWGHSAVWTGQAMVIWGGSGVNDFASDGTAPGTGAFYYPATDSWVPIAGAGAPSGGDGRQLFHYGQRGIELLWTGSKLIALPINTYNETTGAWVHDGGIYDPRTSQWQRIQATGAPDNRRYMAVWNGQELIALGSSYNDFSAASYDFGAQRWTQIVAGQTGSFSGRVGTWAPSVREFFIFGGRLADGLHEFSGGEYGRRGFRLGFGAPPPAPTDKQPPTLALAAPLKSVTATRLRSFTLRGTARDNVRLTRLEYRVQPPGSSYTKWQRGTLTGTGKNRSWSQAVDLPTEGVWRVQVRVADAAGNRSAVMTRRFVVDRTQPVMVVSTPSGNRVSTSGSRYTLKGTASDNVTAVRLDFRVRAPGGRFGAWELLNLSGSAAEKSWTRRVWLNALGEWRVQIRAADRAGNLSGARTIIINRR